MMLVHNSSIGIVMRMLHVHASWTCSSHHQNYWETVTTRFNLKGSLNRAEPTVFCKLLFTSFFAVVRNSSKSFFILLSS